MMLEELGELSVTIYFQLIKFMFFFKFLVRFCLSQKTEVFKKEIACYKFINVVLNV